MDSKNCLPQAYFRRNSGCSGENILEVSQLSENLWKAVGFPHFKVFFSSTIAIQWFFLWNNSNKHVSNFSGKLSL